MHVLRITFSTIKLTLLLNMFKIRLSPPETSQAHFLKMVHVINSGSGVGKLSAMQSSIGSHGSVFEY